MGSLVSYSDWSCLDCAVDFSPGGVWIGYIRPGLEAGSLIVAAPVTGSLVSSTFRMSSDLLVIVRAQRRVMFSRAETPAV